MDSFAYSRHLMVNESTSEGLHLIPQDSSLSLLRPHHVPVSSCTSRGAVGCGPECRVGLFTLRRALGRAAGAVPGRARG